MQLAETASERALADEVRAFLARANFRSEELPHALDDRMAVLRGAKVLAREKGADLVGERAFGGGLG